MNRPIPKVDFDVFAQMASQYTREALFVTEPDFTFVWVNPEFERLFGHASKDVLGKTTKDVLRNETSDQTVFEKYERLKLHRAPIDTEVEYMHKDGSLLWVELRVTPIFDEEGKHIHYISSARDVTKKRAQEIARREATENEQLRQQERRLLSQVSEWLYSAKSLEELLKVISKSLETLMPEAEGQLYIYSNSRDTLDLQSHWSGARETPEYIEADDCWALRRGRAYSYGTRPIEFACGHTHSDEDDSPYFCVPITAHGQTNGLLHLNFGAFAPDRAERTKFQYFLDQRWELALLCAEQISLAIANVQLRQELQDQSVRDPLTNLWNRRWFLDAAHRQVNSSRSSKTHCSVISIDVDHFKKFNDHHGHDAGDLVLRALGSEMIAFFTENCAPCRLGGEEFIVLCDGLDEDETYALAEEFRLRVSALTVKYSGETLPKITISGGVAVWPEDGMHVADLVKAADVALYTAKERGRDQIQRYSDGAEESDKRKSKPRAR